MTENEERFLREIGARLPLASIEEVHLFAPFRQNGAESGVAVIALKNESEVVAPADDASGGASMTTRFIVYTAHYKYMYKGSERGRWEFDIALDADAPLPSIDRVVSGVLQRSGEQGEPMRLTAAEIRAAVGDVDCTATK